MEIKIELTGMLEKGTPREMEYRVRVEGDGKPEVVASAANDAVAALVAPIQFVVKEQSCLD